MDPRLERILPRVQKPARYTGGEYNEIKKDKVVINNLLADGMNLSVKAEHIEINGTVVGENVAIKAFAGKEEDDPDEEKAKKSKLDVVIDTAKSMAADFFNVAHSAKVVIGENAAVYAKGDIDISAKVNQSGGILDITALTDMLNVVNVKVGEAVIDISGKVYSGVSYNAATGETTPVSNATGNIKLNTEVKSGIETGSSQSLLSSLAVSVVVADSEVLIHDGAVLQSAGSVEAEAKSIVSVKTGSSAGKLPLALGIAAVVNDVHSAKV